MLNSNWNLILHESSRHCIEIARDIVLLNPILFEDLLELVQLKKDVFSRRGARVITFSIEANQPIFERYLDDLLNIILNSKDESVTFTLMKVFTFAKLPDDEEKLGKLIEFCIHGLESRVQKLAIKIYAVAILTKIAKLYPDLAYEFALLFNIGMKGASAGYKSKVRHALKFLKKVNPLIEKIYLELDMDEQNEHCLNMEHYGKYSCEAVL